MITRRHKLFTGQPLSAMRRSLEFQDPKEAIKLNATVGMSKMPTVTGSQPVAAASWRSQLEEHLNQEKWTYENPRRKMLARHRTGKIMH